MRRPFPIGDPLLVGKTDMLSQAWGRSFAELYQYYQEVFRWQDPGRADFGTTEPATSYKRVGLLAYADGSNWDPGSGRGYYVWDGSAWNAVVTF